MKQVRSAGERADLLTGSSEKAMSEVPTVLWPAWAPRQNFVFLRLEWLFLAPDFLEEIAEMHP